MPYSFGLVPHLSKTLGKLLLEEVASASNGVMVSKLDYQTYTSEFEISLGALFIRPCATFKPKKLSESQDERLSETRTAAESKKKGEKLFKKSGKKVIS